MKCPPFLKRKEGVKEDCWYQGLALPTSDNNLAIHAPYSVNIHGLALELKLRRSANSDTLSSQGYSMK